jgi:predicted O-methyltransferase YrrM
MAKREHGMSIVDEADKISGWMTREELTFLADQAIQHEFIIEIGSFHGRSTKALSNTLGVVYAIDCVDPIYNHDNDIPQMEALRANLANEIASGKVIVLEARSPECASLFENACADMIFIDGDHKFESVVADIYAWQKKLKPGGLLCGHDYTHAKDGMIEREGVKRAVDSCLNGVNIIGSIWWITI